MTLDFEISLAEDALRNYEAMVAQDEDPYFLNGYLKQALMSATVALQAQRERDRERRPIAPFTVTLPACLASAGLQA